MADFAPHIRTVDELAFHMRVVAAHAENEWEAGLANSILAQARDPNWNPTPKQLGMMRCLVADLFSEAEDFEVIEEQQNPRGGQTGTGFNKLEASNFMG